MVKTPSEAFLREVRFNFLFTKHERTQFTRYTLVEELSLQRRSHQLLLPLDSAGAGFFLILADAHLALGPRGIHAVQSVLMASVFIGHSGGSIGWTEVDVK